MRATSYATLEPPPPLPPTVSVRPALDLTDAVSLLSVWIVLWAFLTLLPHDAPYHAELFLELTLFSWSVPGWTIAIVTTSLLVLLLLVSASGSARPLRFGTCAGGMTAVVLGVAAMVYVLVLNDRYQQNWYNGRLKLCVNHCADPFRACVHAPAPMLDARSAATRAAEAVAFFRARVFGPPIGVVARVVGGGGAVEVVFGRTGRPECVTRLRVPANASRPVLLCVDGVNPYSGALAERYGHAAMSLPTQAPKSCGQGGRIANEAAAANAVAMALQETLGRRVSLYGCSRSGKIAAYAAATKPSVPVYERVLVDSGGTLGLASARQVGRCGEPVAAMLGRWPEWMGANASAARDVADWPARVDVIDLVLGACAMGTRFVVSTSVDDLWNNPNGLVASVDAARRAGCEIPLTLATGSQHCGLL